MKHGAEVRLAADAARPEPDAVTATVTSRYGRAARSWQRRPEAEIPRAWKGHEGALPVIEGTLIRLTVDHLPHEREPKPVWLWTSRPDAGPAEATCAGKRFCAASISSTPSIRQAGPGLDPPETPRSGRRRPLDLARPRRLAQLWLGRRLAADSPDALAAALRARPPHPRPRPPGVSGRPRHHARPHDRTETRPPAPGRQPSSNSAARHPPRRIAKVFTATACLVNHEIEMTEPVLGVPRASSGPGVPYPV